MRLFIYLETDVRTLPARGYIKNFTRNEFFFDGITL